MANSVDPDQTAPLGAVWSGSALFAQAYLSKNLWSLLLVQVFGMLWFEIFIPYHSYHTTAQYQVLQYASQMSQMWEDSVFLFVVP